MLIVRRGPEPLTDRVNEPPPPVTGSPKMLNSATPRPQLASCVLMTVDDDTYSILELAKAMGIYSKCFYFKKNSTTNF